MTHILCDRCGLPDPDRHLETFNFHTTCPAVSPRSRPLERDQVFAWLFGTEDGRQALAELREIDRKNITKCPTCGAPARSEFLDAAGVVWHFAEE